LARFEVGKVYLANGSFDAITIKRRTEKTAWVETYDGYSGYMRIRIDDAGDEFMTDSSVPPRWREEFTYSARNQEG
jgi:hypothetical protein